jgi:hypothetical protein
MLVLLKEQMVEDGVGELMKHWSLIASNETGLQMVQY